MLEKVRSYFFYEEGNLFWKKCKAKWIKPGTIVGNVNNIGYRQTQLEGKKWLVHRLIFLFHHGFLPEVVDHINRNTHDNRIENLRCADKVVNAYNSKISSKNTSGYKGVSWDKRKSKWLARSRRDGKYHHVGYYASPEEASTAYQEFVRKGGSL